MERRQGRRRRSTSESGSSGRPPQSRNSGIAGTAAAAGGRASGGFISSWHRVAGECKKDLAAGDDAADGLHEPGLVQPAVVTAHHDHAQHSGDFYLSRVLEIIYVFM